MSDTTEVLIRFERRDDSGPRDPHRRRVLKAGLAAAVLAFVPAPRARGFAVHRVRIRTKRLDTLGPGNGLAG